MIFTLTYLSTLTDAVTRADLDVLLDKSRAHNSEQQITGLLLLRQRRVMQVLEGSEEAVRALYRRISDDPRHVGVTTVWTSSAEHRRFPDWTMGFDDLAGPEQASTEPELPESPTQSLALEQRSFIENRIRLLRRGLASGDRLISTLAVILHAHETEHTLVEGTVYLRCRECRSRDDPGLDRYPCATASNASWALDAAI